MMIINTEMISAGPILVMAIVFLIQCYIQRELKERPAAILLFHFYEFHSAEISALIFSPTERVSLRQSESNLLSQTENHFYLTCHPEIFINSQHEC